MSASGINGMLSMGIGALFASQASIQTTGSNIANVNTAGYVRRAVRLEEKLSIDSNPGQIGQGVDATEVYRYFNKFVESAYLARYSSQRRYEEEYDLATNVETLFNESNVDGLAASIERMFASWNDLAKQPDSSAARSALMENMKSFTSSVRATDGSLVAIQDQMDQMIKEQVDHANLLIKQIAELNGEITAHSLAGRNNPNATLDERDQKVRELSGILNLHVDDKGPGGYYVTTGNGMLLVQDNIPFSLEMHGPQVAKSLTSTSTYGGTMGFSGKDGVEYHVEIVQPGTVDTTGAATVDSAGVVVPAGVATYKLSLDGGKTWVIDESTGKPKEFCATDRANSARVKELDLYFTDTGSSLTKGDAFTITPKSDVFWVSPTVGPIDISTQIMQDGTDNGMRMTGGSLAGFLEFRDYKIGEYRNRLKGFTESMAWEMNRIHSQGTGMEKMSLVLGDYKVDRVDVPLGSRSSGSPFFDRLQEGNVTFGIYDSTSGANVIPYPGISAFSPTNFDPKQHSLTDVADAITAGPAGAYMTATVVDGRLQLDAKPGFTFSVTADTSGLAAALGINTILSGETPSEFGVNQTVVGNINFLNTARTNGVGEGNNGDNQIAREIAALANKNVFVGSAESVKVKQSLPEYYAGIMAKVGADTATLKFISATERAMASDLNEKREAISGVNLDEEMSSLIKFQASYKAAAKLITTSDQMLQTLLGLKQ